MRTRLLLCCALLLLASCGVKLPPIAPERDPGPPQPPLLDCSPTEPDCDRTDPNYKPRQ